MIQLLFAHTRCAAFTIFSLLAMPVFGQPCTTAPAGLTAWWRAENATADAKGGFNATLVNGTTYATGKVGQAFQLDGIDDFVNVPDNNALDVGTANFTVDLWVNFDSTDGEQILVEKYVETFGAGTQGWSLTKLSGNGLRLATAGGDVNANSLTIPTNTWIHFSVRRFASSSVALFMNGAQVGSGSISADLSSTSSLKFGHRGNPTDTPGSSDTRGFFLKGRIDEVHVFVGLGLTQTEISDIYNAGSGGFCISCGNGAPDSGEDCDDGNSTNGDGCDTNCTVSACGNGVQAGSEACDDGNAVDTDACKSDCTLNVCGDGVVETGVGCDDGNLLDGDGCDSDCTVSGPCAPVPVDLTGWWTADGSGADIQSGYDAEPKNGAGFAVGRSRLAFNLDGVNDYLKVPDNAALDVGSGDFTVDMWVNFNSTAGEQVLVEKYVETFNDAASGWSLTKLDGNQIRVASSFGNIDSRRLSLNPNTWIHFAARRSGTGMSVFMNGMLIAESEVVGDLSSPSSLKFGHRGSPSDTPGSLDTRGFFFNGRIDEVHFVVGRALTDMEIQDIVGAGRSGLCVPTPTCQNTLVEAGEACDDGNALNGDGCESDCTLSCGNGNPDPGEACDDGNAVSGDGCDSDCSISACGNGVIAGSEDCEDGNTVNGDGCDNNCTLTECGNAITTAGESCDDGNAVDGDGCESDCTITEVEEMLPPGGGTVGTDPMGNGASPQAPAQVSLTTGSGGTVTIAAANEPLTPAGVLELIRQILIEAPPATAADPLVIVLTVDASAIPPGVDLLHTALIRNGLVVPDCTGAPGTASPDPCIQSRVVLTGGAMEGDVQITGLTSHASQWGVGVSSLTKSEQECVNGVSKAGIGVTKAQAKASANCLKAASKGEVADAQACLSADSAGKVAGSKQKTTDFAAARCVPAPLFGFTSAAATNTAAQQAALALSTDIFGGNLTSVVATDKAGAACQSAVLKGAQKLFSLSTQLFRDCQEAGLGRDVAPIVTSAQLETCFDNLTVSAKLLKNVSKLGKVVLGKCGANSATLLPGACGSSRNVAYCIETRVECRICQMLNAMSGLSEDCDLFDDFEANSSCS